LTKITKVLKRKHWIIIGGTLTLIGLVLSYVFLTKKNDPYSVDIVGVKIPLKFFDYTDFLGEKDTLKVLNIEKELLQKDTLVHDNLLGSFYRLSYESDTAFLRGYRNIVKDPAIQEIQKALNQKCTTLLPLEQNTLYQGFQRMKVLLPKIKQPHHIFWINSLFNSSVSIAENGIAIGVERYLGPSSKVVQRLPSNPFYAWIKEGMDESYLARDVISGWLSNHALKETKGSLAEEMIRWGKILVITEKLLPDNSTATVLRYQDKDLNWALASEASIWKYLINEQLLYDKGEDTQQSLLHEGPFTGGLPHESPDRLGQFMGYRIVLQYVEQHHPSLESLLNIPYLTLLQAYEVPEKK